MSVTLSGRTIVNRGVVTENLLLYLDAANEDSYPGTGTTWTDLINGTEGTLTNGPTYSSNDGGVIEFDGTDDYFVIDNDLDSYSSVTAAIWIKKDSYINDWETYFSYGAEEAALTDGWGVRRSSNTTRYQFWGGDNNTSISLYVNGVLNDSASGQTHKTTDYDVNSLGEWQHVCLTVSGATSFGSHSRLTFGVRSDSLTSTFSSPSIGGFLFYDRVLSDEEIYQNYRATKKRFE
jgi:hypothetical protein